MKKFVVVTLAAAAFMSVNAAAEQAPSFNFASVSYLHQDYTGGSAGGFDLKGNVSLYENIFAEADVNRVSKSGVTSILSEVGIGYGYNIAPATALVASAGIAHQRASIKNFPTATDTGQYATVGVRTKALHEDVELGAKVIRNWMDASFTSYAVEGRYYFQENLSADFGYRHIQRGADLITVGVAYHF